MIGNCYIVMWILIISLVLLGVIALIAGIIRNKRLQKKIEKGELDRMPEVKEVDVECCGQHEVCERDSLLAAVRRRNRNVSGCIVYDTGCRSGRMGTQPSAPWH